MAKVMDIGIKQLKSILKKESDIDTFLSSEVKIEEKTDGVKIQLFLKNDASNKKPLSENWIVAYKGNVLSKSEFGYNDDEEAKQSLGASQYKFIFDILEKVDVDKLPKGYQFFCEYLIKKPTLMSNYTDLYNLILLSYGKSNCQVKNGIMICDNSKFGFDDKREQYASILGIHTPPLVFEGILFPYSNLIQNVKSPKIRELLPNGLDKIDNKQEYFKLLLDTFLEAESKFGGKPEGFVVWYNDKPYKFQQEYQLSKEERLAMKNATRGTMDEETIYWANIKDTAKNILSTIDTKNKSIDEIFSEIGKAIKNLGKDSIIHPKKNWATIKDDLFLTAKLNVLKMIAPKTGLIVGKFRVLSKKHYQLIKKALLENEYLILALTVARGKDKTLEFRKKLISNCFKDEIDKIEFVSTQNGLIPKILQKSIFGIGLKSIYAGTDRIESYKSQLKFLDDNINVIELKRNDDVSATNILNNIEDYDYFKKNTPPCSWTFYDEIKEIYQND